MYRKKKVGKFSSIDIMDQPEDIIVQVELLTRSFNRGFIGCHYLRMLMVMWHSVIGVKELGTYQEEMKCLNNLSLNMKYLLFGA